MMQNEGPTIELPNKKVLLSKQEFFAITILATLTLLSLVLNRLMHHELASLCIFIVCCSALSTFYIAYRNIKAVTIVWLTPLTIFALGIRLGYIGNFTPTHKLSIALILPALAAIPASFLVIKKFYSLYPHPKTPIKHKYEQAVYFSLLLSTVTIAAFLSKINLTMISFGFLCALPFLTGVFIALFSHINQPTTTSVDISRLCWQNFLMFMIIAAFMLEEGIICLVMAAPILCGLLFLGGYIGHALCKIGIKPTSNLTVIAALPILLFTPQQEVAKNKNGNTYNEIIINAPVEKVWQQINHVDNIQPSEVDSHFIYKIGVPTPISGMTIKEGGGLVRQVTWQKNIHFEEKITEYIPNQKISWNFHFNKDSFPSYALDEHVTIGGQYFDLLKASYTLMPYQGNKTKLGISIDYRLSTDLNWYANMWAQISMNSFSHAVLELYQNRLESKT